MKEQKPKATKEIDYSKMTKGELIATIQEKDKILSTTSLNLADALTRGENYAIEYRKLKNEIDKKDKAINGFTTTLDMYTTLIKEYEKKVKGQARQYFVLACVSLTTILYFLYLIITKIK